jgi:hypothetical protein
MVGMFMIFAASSFAAGEKMEHKSSTQQMTTTGFSADRPLMLSEVMGKDLVGQGGEKLGEVKDFLVSSDGEISFALVSKGGKFAPVPWSSISRGTKEGQFAANITKDRFDNAPTLSKDEIKNLAQSEIEQKVHGYYGEGMRPGMEHMERERTTPESGATTR